MKQKRDLSLAVLTSRDQLPRFQIKGGVNYRGDVIARMVVRESFTMVDICVLTADVRNMHKVLVPFSALSMAEDTDAPSQTVPKSHHHL
jgi:hypothetical protein